MGFSEWRECKLDEIIDINPRESIAKGQLAKKVSMEKLKPFEKVIDGYELAEFKGGAKFRNGDTLLARITPCLENGKTAQVTILEKDEVGFGSTEFIVLRAKPGKADSDFVYYLAISPKFREIAIQSMVGTSGRQRVQQDVLKNTVFFLPEIAEQKAIAAILSSLDEKIELNNRINKTLEEIAKAIFKSWFVDFEPFQDGEFVDSELGSIPKGWRVSTLGEIAEITSGKRPPVKSNTMDSEMNIPVVGASGVMAYTNRYLFDEDILVIGRVGTHGIVQRFFGPVWPSDNTLVIRSSAPEFVGQVLCTIDYTALNRGSTQPLITQSDLKKWVIIIPDSKVLANFEEIISRLTLIWRNNNEQNRILTNIRDTFLPKLMSGEIRFPVEEV